MTPGVFPSLYSPPGARMVMRGQVMATVAIVSNEHTDEAWIARAVDGALAVVDTNVAGVLVIEAACLDGLLPLLSPDAMIVVIGDPSAPPERAAHVITRAWPDEAVRALLGALAARRPHAEPASPAPSTPSEALAAQRVVAATRKLSAVTDLKACETAVVEALVELVEADRAYCLYYDPAGRVLWSESKEQAGGDARTPQSGLAGYAVLTGHAAVAERAGDDPRFAGAIDDPDGDASDRIVARPIFGGDGHVHAVVVCARRARRPAFGPADLGVLARFARLVTPVLDQLSLDVHAQQILDEAAGDEGLFRREALAQQSAPRWGDVVRVSPGWVGSVFWVFVVLLAAAITFLFVGTVATYSKGPAIVRTSARRAVIAPSAGNVVAVEVTPGMRAEVGTVIARLDDSEQRTAVDRLAREMETQLRRHMLQPTDASADAAVRSTMHDLEAARSSLRERAIVATTAGTIGDVRVRPGQRVVPGDFVASLLDTSRGLEVVALLPGEDRPRLAAGMTLRLELAGYRYAYHPVAIQAVSTEVIAPSEARRVLGADVADGVRLDGPVVVVHGKLVAEEFVVDGRTLKYHDGMLGTGEVRIGEESILFALVPAARRWQ